MTNMHSDRRHEDCALPERLEPTVMDPAQCPYRDTCPHLMLCVSEFIAELARADWGLPPNEDENDE